MPRYSSFGQLDDQIVDDADLGFVSMNNRLRPDQLKAGFLADSQNGRMGINGEWQPRKGIDVVAAPLVAGGSALVLPFYLYSNKTISSASRSGSTVTVNFSSAHGFTDETLVSISGLTGYATGQNPNGNRIVTVTSSTQITFTLPGTATVTYGGTSGSAYAGGPILDDNGVNAIYGSCLYSNPNSNSEAYIIIASNSRAFAVKLSNGATTSIAYPSAETISTDVSLLQAFNKVFIFREGNEAFEWNGVLTGSPAFTKVASGSYATTAYLDSSNNTVITDGVVTVSETGHGLSIGDMVYIIDNGSSTLTTNDGGYRVATVPSANSFTFFAEVPDLVSHKVVYAKKQPSDIGFSYMPAPPWAVYHQRRLWMPFYYTQATVAGDTVYTSRGVRDELIVSDILDSNTYDQVYNQYRFNAGTSDYVVALHPFAEDKLVVFNRNSIHLVVSQADITQSSVQLITNEVGCLARKSVIQVADNVLFLSDNGIYGANFQDLYNLRGNGVPLSDSIQATINRINKSYAQNAVAAYFDNRYYIALPLDNSTTNNYILVYNFLNRGWESIDTVYDSEGEVDENWEITDLFVGGDGETRGLYCVSKTGGVHRLEHREFDADDNVVTQIGSLASERYIVSSCTTRMFTYGVTDRKRFTDFDLHVESAPTLTSDITIEAECENYDDTIELGRISSRLGGVLDSNQDASIRGRLGQPRSYGLQFIFTPTVGRPRIRTIKVAASITNRALTSLK